jgi:medium-chain acyl-[acyl-carrier-protein] hydrolase
MATVDLRLWREEFKIHSYEIGPSGYVTPQSICRFLQEVASNHALAIGVSGDAQKNTWVLSQLSLRMSRYPRWHQSMTIETWPVLKLPIGVRGHRDFILRDQGGREIGKASTVWLLLDEKTRRPTRMPLGLKEFASEGHAENILRAVKEDEMDGVMNALDFRIRGSDIDWNLHVNNVCYLEWALETVPAEFRLQNMVTELDISFVAEGKYGNEVISERFPTGEGTDSFFHRISEKTSRKPLGLLRTTWGARE